MGEGRLLKKVPLPHAPSLRKLSNDGNFFADKCKKRRQIAVSFVSASTYFPGQSPTEYLRLRRA